MHVSIFALGSCRLILPIKHLAAAGGVRFVNEDRFWYAHNTKEFLQRLRVMKGELVLPDNIAALTMDTDSCATDLSRVTEGLPSADVGVFEISTRNIKSLEGYTIHSMLAEKRKLSGHSDRFDSFEDLEADLRHLQAYFPKLVIGCNITRDANLIDVNIHRAQLNDAIKEMASRMPNVIVVDPNTIISKGKPRAQLEDNNHFLPSFVPKVAALYRDAFNRLSEGDKASKS